MIQLGLGLKGAANVAKGGFVLGLVVSVGIESLDFMLNDERTMYDFVGAIGIEAVKAGLAVATGVLTAKFVTGVATLVGVAAGTAVAPVIIVALAVGGAAIGLNWLDNHYQIKEAVIKALKELPETLGELGQRPHHHFKRGIKHWVNQW